VETCLIILSLGACAAVKYERECLVCTGEKCDVL